MAGLCTGTGRSFHFISWRSHPWLLRLGADASLSCLHKRSNDGITGAAGRACWLGDALGQVNTSPHWGNATYTLGHFQEVTRVGGVPNTGFSGEASVSCKWGLRTCLWHICGNRLNDAPSLTFEKCALEGRTQAPAWLRNI